MSLENDQLDQNSMAQNYVDRPNLTLETLPSVEQIIEENMDSWYEMPPFTDYFRSGVRGDPMDYALPYGIETSYRRSEGPATQIVSREASPPNRRYAEGHQSKCTQDQAVLIENPLAASNQRPASPLPGIGDLQRVGEGSSVSSFPNYSNGTSQYGHSTKNSMWSKDYYQNTTLSPPQSQKYSSSLSSSPTKLSLKSVATFGSVSDRSTGATKTPTEDSSLHFQTKFDVPAQPL
jgi:hypothetical protein